MVKITSIISVLSVFIPLVCGLVLKQKNKVEWLLVGLVVVSFLSDFICLYFARMGQSTYWIINTYQYAETVLVFVFFYFVLGRKKYVLALLFFILCLSIVDHVDVGNHALYHRTLSVKSLVVIVCCLIYFVDVFNRESDIFIEYNPVFWMVVGLLVYFSGSLFSWILSSYASPTNPYKWMFHNLANILKNILFAIGLWKARLTR